jgi:uncharacterized protein (DUF1697 family)
MSELTAILEYLGCTRVRTHIQSGNAVFRSGQEDLSDLSRKISTEISDRRGFKPFLKVLELEEVEKVLDEYPFGEPGTDPKTLHIGFLASPPVNPDLRTLGNLKTDSEEFLLKGNVFYLHSPEGVGRSKLSAKAEKVLGVAMTERNVRTVRKVRDMAKELG